MVALADVPLAQAPPPPPPVAADEGRPPPGLLPIEDGRAGWADVPVAEDTLAQREAPAHVLSRYREDPDFTYDRPRAERPSLWSRLWDWVLRTLLDPIFEGATTQAGQWILIFLFLLLLGWGVTRLLRADVGPLFARRDLDGAAGPLLDVDDIAEVDLRIPLADALRDGRFRDAVRFRYLLALQSLDARGALRWSRHKTNREYVREVRESEGSEVANAFAEVTRIFDFVWYGERPVDRARFDRLGPLFDRLGAATEADPQPADA